MIEFIKKHPFLVRSVYRRAYQNVNPMFFSTVHVNEFPKSGGTWICRMLRDCLDWRLDDNAYPLPGKAIVKHHRLSFALKPTITVIRDPRDVAVSYYYHCRRTFDQDGFNHNIVRMMNERVFSKCSTRREEIQAFVEMLIKEPISPGFTWGQFYAATDRDVTTFVRYEDLRTDPAKELKQVLDAIGQQVSPQKIADVVGNHDINKILETRKDAGAAHFIRKGRVGGWRDDLDNASVAMLEEDAGDLLGRYGYA